MHTEAIFDKHLDIPIEQGIHLRRGPKGQPWTNVPHLVVHHSPTGYEWGYGGSGPADLALNIAEMMLHRYGYVGERMQCYDGECFTLAWHLHQQLKREIIAVADRDREVISYATIDAWLMAHRPPN